MKRIVSLFAIILACVSFSSCQKETNQSNETKTHKVTFKAVMDEETKTVLSGNHADWVDTDADLFHIFEDGVQGTDIDVSFENGIATIEAIFTGDESATHTYTAFVGNINTSNKASVKTTQDATSSSYDPNADILFAKPISDVTGEDAFNGLTFQFKRVVAINKMTLKGIADGETVQKVVLEGNYSILFSYDAEGNKEAGTKLLTINTSSKDVYFVTSEASNITLTATVTTDKAVYTKQFGPISFKENGYKPFGVTFTDRKTSDKEYALVTNVNDLNEGDIIVLGCASANKAAGQLGANAYFSSQDATITNYVLKSANAVEITLGKAEDHWTLNTSEGTIGATSAGKLSVSATATNYVGTWDITISSEGVATITSTSSNYGSIFCNTSSPRFTTYTSTSMTPIEIYKYGASAPTSYDIVLPTVEHLTFNTASEKAFPGSNVTITATPDLGYSLKTFTASVSGEELNGNVLTFKMPENNVNVSASVEKKEGQTYVALFGSSYNSAKVSSYTGAFSATNDSFKVNLQNFNNNNSGWDYVKAGYKTAAIVGTITTDVALPVAIKTVSITIDAITANSVNSITLYSGTSSSSITKSEGTFSLESGIQTVTIETPTKDQFYKISFDCKKGSSNGLVTVSKIEFSE